MKRNSARGGLLRALARRYSTRSRRRRGAIFREFLEPSAQDRILDLGSEDGSHIASVVPFRENVVIADIEPEALRRGAKRYGFKTLELDESGTIPVPDKHFDIVFCSSVIEHVTIDKDKIDLYRSSRDFAEAAFKRQQRFANEIRRVGRRYFVQTPSKYFVIESHTWLPGFIVLLPRRVQLRILAVIARWWPKKTLADWNLLTAGELSELFPEALIIKERSLGMTKSLIAIKQKD